ncbi:ribonuclease HII [Bullifex porci]|uniref:ribonuclease HII n=1 Tax=Bullifex porci TaxID=2606638 RepID=UPI0023EFB153|nr:ribonuclease HII [Bullifex porci]MDD7588019.1 ribonuclease HII [Bullifex porci]
MEMEELFSFNEVLTICGTDEAGRGPLAGPVTAAAVVLPKDFPFEILADSKKLSHNKLIEAEKVIREKAVAFSISFISNEEIDEINILNAALKAMANSYKEVNKIIHVDKLMVDGNRSPRKFIEDSSLAIETVVKGDSKIHEIMAASILAKTARDRFMEALDKEYPQYGFSKNKGYPSKEHQEAIIKYGLSPYHRKTFHLKNVKIKEEQDLFPL